MVDSSVRGVPYASEIVDESDDCVTLYAFDLELTQSNLPYQPVEGRRLESLKHFVLYADTVTLRGELLNPGRDIRIYARQLVVAERAALDVGGADPDADYPAGVPVEQADPLPGAAGTDGRDGGDGGAAGNIVVCAGEIVNLADKSPAVDTVELGGALYADLFREVLSGYLKDPSRHPSSYGTFRFKTSFLGQEQAQNIGAVALEGLEKSGLEAFSLDLKGRFSGRFGCPDLVLTLATTDNSRSVLKLLQVVFRFDGVLSGSGDKVEMNAELEVTKAEPEFSGWMAMSKLDAGNLAHALQPMQRLFEEQIAAPLVSVVVKRREEGEGSEPTLSLLADGGRGGRGEDGHNGVAGRDGPDDAYSKELDERLGLDYARDTNPDNPHAGGPGGRAGAAGHSGDGGDGGAISLLVNCVHPIVIGCSNGAGRAGGAARAGAPGRGGRGGFASFGSIMEHGRLRNYSIKAIDGANGGGAKFNGEAGKGGSAGAPLKVNLQEHAPGQPLPGLAPARLAPLFPPTQLLITRNVADLYYLNAKEEGDHDYAYQLYSWLLEINQPFIDGLVEPAPGAEEAALREAIHAAAAGELVRMSRGLDFYGHGVGWTPVLNLKGLLERTGELLVLGEIVERQFNAYAEEGREQKERLRDLKRMNDDIEKRLDDSRLEEEGLATQIESLRQQMERYNRDVDAQKAKLIEREYAFKKELTAYLIEKHQTDFDAFLEMLGVVVAAAGGIAGGVGGIAAGAKAVSKASGLVKGAAGVVKVLKSVKGSIDSLQKGFKAIKGYVTPDEPNAAKLLVEQEKFDEMLEEYLGEFDAADELREAIDYYLELTQARNQLACNFTALVTRRAGLEAQRVQTLAETRYIGASISSHQNNLLPLYTAYMRKCYDQLKQELMRNLYLENRAYQYWSLGDHPLELSNLNVAMLAASHQRLVKRIDLFRENNEAFDPFTQKVVVDAERFREAFAALAESRCLTFRLDIRETPGFLNMRHIIAQRFEIAFPDIEGGSEVLYLSLIHGGDPVLNRLVELEAPGSLRHFTHRPRPKPYKIDYANPANTAGGVFGESGQGYSGLSPFSSWKIDFDLKGNEWLDLKRIRRVEITFHGRFLGPNRVID
ncbi:hypothetical protein [Endothiovibrio diazotrophicus]